MTGKTILTFDVHRSPFSISRQATSQQPAGSRLTSRRPLLYDADKKMVQGEEFVWSNDLTSH